MADLDACVREVLGAKFDMGLFANPFLRMGKPEDDPVDVGLRLLDGLRDLQG